MRWLPLAAVILAQIAYPLVDGDARATLVVAAAMMVALDRLAGGELRPVTVDAPVLALYLWTYGSSVLAHAVFLDLPRSALVGGVGMGLVAIPLGVALARR